MDFNKCKTAVDWYKQLCSDGYLVPPEAPRAMRKAMKENGFSFSRAYDYLIEKEVLILSDRTYIVDLSYFNF